MPGYVTQFQTVYGGPATPDNIVTSLTTFFRTLNSENALWDKYEMGDVKAVSKEAVEDYKLFAGKGQFIDWRLLSQRQRYQAEKRGALHGRRRQARPEQVAHSA